MRGAFVIRLGPETKTTEGHFQGSVEEVDSCTELRFHSTEELLRFLGERFDLAIAALRRNEQLPEASDKEEKPCKEGESS